jgi:hypothetical protein
VHLFTMTLSSPRMDYRKRGNLDVSQPYGPVRSVTGISFPCCSSNWPLLYACCMSYQSHTSSVSYLMKCEAVPANVSYEDGDPVLGRPEGWKDGGICSF